MGGGKRRINKSKRKNSSSLFVQGGILSDWNTLASPPSKGKSSSNRKGNPSNSASRSVNSGGKQKGAIASSSGTKVESQKPKKGSAFGYVYPAVERQEGTLKDVSKDGAKNMDVSDPIVLFDSGNTQIYAYVDEKSLMEPKSVKYTYEYSAGLGSDNTPHRGLGFSEETEMNPDVPLLSSNVEHQEGSGLDSPSFEEEMETDVTCVDELSEGDDLLARTPSPEKNSGYLSIGGMKLYTQDVSCGESEEDDNELSYGESMESSESEESCGSSESDGSSDSDSSIDEDVAEDYFEGIGGSKKVVNADRLIGKIRKVNDEGLSGGNYIDTLQKLGGIDLQDASREYGLKKTQLGNKHRSKPVNSGTGEFAWSSALDDLMVVKDYRTGSGKKKHGSRFPQSWPSDAQKSKHFRRFPGEKKKLRKETIAHKRWERMINRGVDLEEINLKLQQMVLDGNDILSFQPMHSRDCSQVRRLASIYCLHSGCQGSGKKRFVTVIRTERTCMPSSSGRVRLEKLIGAGNEDADFTINDIKGDRKLAKRGSKGFGQGAPNKSFKSSGDRNGTKEVQRKKKSEDKRSYAAQPMSFVSSGVMHSESEIRTLNSTEPENSCHDKKDVSSSYGAFELHTTGFGSKMMAKMGYVEGEGLGKDRQGRAEVIEVFQRPKSLGLGANVPEPTIAGSVKGTQPPKKSSVPGAKGPKTRNKLPGNESQQFASFEKHTKGFGSKLMAKMGFVEGTGLGRDSQGIINPLVASRLPKSRGLGAKG